MQKKIGGNSGQSPLFPFVTFLTNRNICEDLMQCFYITLREQIERQQLIEKNFADSNFGANWRLDKIEAFDRNYVNKNAPDGKLSAANKSLSLTHRKFYELAFKYDGHVLLCEDDTIFSEDTSKIIEKVIGSLKNKPWDILYTDALFPDPWEMVKLFKLRQRLEKAGKRIDLLDLAKINYCATGAFIVNENSKQKIFELIREYPSFFDISIDLVYRNLVHAGKLKAFCIFPFVTSLSALADISSIQPQEAQITEMAWTAYRRLMWIEADPVPILSFFDNVNPDYFDDRTLAFSKIMSVMLAEKYFFK